MGAGFCCRVICVDQIKSVVRMSKENEVKEVPELRDNKVVTIKTIVMAAVIILHAEEA